MFKKATRLISSDCNENCTQMNTLKKKIFFDLNVAGLFLEAKNQTIFPEGNFLEGNFIKSQVHFTCE